MTDPDIFEKLSERFNISDIHWRVGATNKRAYDAGNADERKGMPVVYVDARNVMDRLDEVLGPENWSDSYQDFDGRVICTIGVRCAASDDSSEWVYKSDGAGDTDIEGAKGGLSDAFKRAAVKWGIGRYLYGCKIKWIELTDRWDFPKNFDGSLYLTAFSSKQMKTKVWNALKDAASEDDAAKARETWDELNNDQQNEIWRDFSSGIRATIKQLLQETT